MTIATIDGGLPMAYEVLSGNTADKATLTSFLEKIQSMYGKARRVWVMDRGHPHRGDAQEDAPG
jgi:transposase